MSEIIKDYSKAEIQQGIKTDMSTAMSKGKIDLRGVANNRRIKVQNNIIKIKNDLVMHGKMDRDTENKFQKFKNKYKQLCDIDLPKITKEFAFVRNVENKKTYIEQFAIKLDTYEDEVLSLLKPLVQLKNEENNFFKCNQDSQENDFISICGPNLIRFIKGQDANDKSIILNKSTNPIPIHEILQESSINEGEVRKIDYSGCTSERIKNKMVNCLGGKESCYISYCDETKTYNLFDEQGYLLSQRAYIWEGVKLFPPYLLKWEGSQNAKNAAEKTAIDNMKNISSDKEKELQGRIPERLKKQLNEAQQKEFIKYTEKILNSAVLSARKGGEQLSGEPIKLTNFDGLKLYTVTEHNRYYRDLFPNKYYKISDELNSILNKNERYVQVYLSSRVQEKWNDASTFSNTDIIDVNPTIEDEELMVENVRNFEKGIDALMGILGNYKTRVVPESFTWEAKDQFVADLETYLNNLIATIESGVVYKSLLKQAEKDISDKLKKCGFVHDGSKSIENFVNTILESGDDERQLALRSLGESSNWMRHDTSLSSDQLRNTVINKDNIKIEKEEYDVCLKNIEEYFLVGDSDIVDGDKKCINAKNIDELYGCESGKEVFDFFKNKKLIPEKGDYSDFKDVCENIFRKIQTDNNQIEKYQLEIKNNSREWLNEEYNRVLAKDNKDENDISFLNKYEFLVSPKGKDILDDMIKNVLPSVVKNIKYCNAVPFLKGTLGLQLARSGGGLSKSGLNGTDLDIVKEFNDSIGAGGLFDLKDESVETNINIAKEVVKEVIICLVVMALTEGTAASLLEARRVKNLGKWGSRAVNWIVKGSLFNMYSLVINNTLDLATGRKVVTEIGEGLNIFNGRNREGYAGSVAFFAIMEMIPIGLVKVGTKIGGKYLINALVKSGKAEKEAIDILLKASNSGSIEQFMNFAFSVKEVGNLLKVIETAGVKTTAFGVELGSMLLASEVTTLMSTGGFEKISDEELAHTIAMILAFKGVGKIKSIIKGKDGKPVVEIESEKDGKIREVTADELDGWKDTFDKQIFGDGYTDPVGNTWKITYENTPSQNANRKGVWKLIKNGKVIRSVKGEPGVIPGEYSGTFPGETKGDIRGNGNNFREFYADCWAEYTKLQMDNIYKLTGEKVVDAVHDQSTGSAHVEDVVESKNNGPELKPDVSTGKNNISERGNPSEGRSKEELQRSKEENSKHQAEAEKKQAELQQKKTELERQREENRENGREQQISIENISEILKNGDIITIDGLKYKFSGIKGGEAEFVIDVNANRSAEMSGRNPKDVIRIKELSELKDPRFNLEPGNKKTNLGRNAKLDELLNKQKIEPLDRLNNKINNKKSEIKTIQEQIERLEKGKNTIVHNEYFEIHKGEILGRNLWIDGVKYEASFVDKQGNLHFKQVDGSNKFSVNSFSQLKAKGQVNGFSDGFSNAGSKIKGSDELSRSEVENHTKITELLKGEQDYLGSRNINAELEGKRLELQRLNIELQGLESKLSASEAQAAKIRERAKKGEEINKELNKVNEELNKVEKQLEEAKRLAKKYTDEISKLESDKASKEAKTTALGRETYQETKAPQEKETHENITDKFAKEMGSALHEERRLSWKQQHGEEPRIKTTKDKAWIEAHNGKTEVDIAHTKFEDLPSDRQYENLEAAKVAVDLVYDKIAKGETITPEILEEMSSKVHDEGLKRNTRAKDSELDKSYKDLPEAEKVKDRNQILQAIETVGGKEARTEIEKRFERETKDALTHDENELLNNIVKEVETLPENTSKKYNLGNGDKIEIKKLPNGNFVEMNSVIKTDAESLTIQNPVSKEMIPSELEAYIKEKIIRGRENQQRGQIDKNSVYTPTVEGQVVETIETKDVSESTNINEIVEVIQQLNPDAKIQLGNEYGQVASDYIYSSVPMDRLVLPEGFYYDKKNGITNKHKTNSGKYINFSVYDIKGVDGKRFYTKDKNNETSGRQGNEKPFVSDELGHTTNTDGINLVEGQVINTELSNLNEYISIDKNGEVKFKEGLLSNDFLGRSYITIEGKKYKVFSKGRGNGAGCMIGSREVRMGGQTLEGLTSRGSFDFKIGNFKNGELNGYGVKIGRGIKEEGNFKNGELEGKGARTGTNGSKYEGNFVNGELKKGIEISNNGGAKKVKFVGDVDLNYIKDQANILGDKLASGEIMEIEIPNGGKLTIKNNEGILVENLEGLDILIEGKLGNYIENGIKTRDKNGGYKKGLDIEAQIISKSQLETLKSLGKGRNENLYLSEFGEPKNVISLGNGEKLYVSNCLQKGNRKYIVGYVQKGGELKLRLFYRSNSEGIRRSCPGERACGGYSKGENITNSCYETTTRVINELQYKFDNLSIEQINKDPIKVEGIPFNALESEMDGEIKIDKLFDGLENNTVEFFQKYNSTVIKDRYRSLGDNFDINGMNLVEGKGYTYEHQFLGTIDVEICRLNYNGKDLDFSFAKVKNDPNRVRIEEVKYADAKITSFGIYDKQINAAPLTGKPIDYYNQVPLDMQNNSRLGQSDYIDIRDLYQENPIIKKYKEIKGIKENQYMEHKKAA